MSHIFFCGRETLGKCFWGFFFQLELLFIQKVETGERSLLVTGSLVLISQRALLGLDLLHKIRGLLCLKPGGFSQQSELSKCHHS